MGTLLRVAILRIIVYWGLYWGPLFQETTKSQYDGSIVGIVLGFPYHGNLN